MYENKKASALKTLEKKQNKVDEINQLLSEEITPTLEKLQRERANYMLWVSNNNEIERLTRFTVAYEYVQVQGRLNSKNHQLEDMEENLQKLALDIKVLADRETTIQAEVKERTTLLNKHRTQDQKDLEEESSKLSKEVTVTESKLKNRNSDLEAELAGRKKNQKHLDEMRKQVEAKEKVYLKEKAKFDKLAEEEATIKKEIEKSQWSVQALTAGMSTKEAPAEGQGEGQGRSLREELLAAQTRLSEMEAEHKKKAMGIEHLSKRIKETEEQVAKSKQDGKRLSKEKSNAESSIAAKKAELEKLNFDPQRFATLDQMARQGEAQLHSNKEKMDALRAHLGGIDFNYQDPYRGFDRRNVKGVVAKLFQIQPDYAHFHRALEVCAGGRLFFVVVDSEETGKALLEKGQLRRRVTIIPLNKIVDPSLHPDVVRRAKSIAPAGAELHSALEIIGFDKQVQSAMKYVFGGQIVCDTPETAKQVTFHPNVRVRTVTKDGDVYDPAGTITGGSAPRGGGLLHKLQELCQLEQQYEKDRKAFEQVMKQREQMRNGTRVQRDRARAEVQGARVLPHRGADLPQRASCSRASSRGGQGEGGSVRSRHQGLA